MKRYVCTPLESHPTPFRSKLLSKHDNLRISPRLKSHNHFERKWWQTCQKMLTRQTWKKLLFLNQKYRYNWLNNRKLIYRTFYPRVSKNNNTAEITVSCPQCAETPATRQWNRIWLLLKKKKRSVWLPKVRFSQSTSQLGSVYQWVMWIRKSASRSIVHNWDDHIFTSFVSPQFT